ncbi:MAG: hypothetical protein P8J37_22595 [Fuerstiella sp.]|nr:hypothetical protein [Fuerstiella sp.]
MRQFVLTGILLAAFLPRAISADQSFLERFALAADRDAVLKELIPGKAYAKMKNGSTQFYKDGHTDLRGRFDYASLSTNDLD